MKKKFDNLPYYMNTGNINNKILSLARERGQIIYGGQAIKKSLGISARRTMDYDIFDKNSKEAARIIQRRLDRLTSKNKDDFYVKKGVNKSTWKVKYIGRDGRRGTSDDVSIADYTKTPRPAPRFFIYNGVRYRTLSGELAAKARLLRDPIYSYRKEKDSKDLTRIKSFLKSRSRRIR